MKDAMKARPSDGSDQLRPVSDEDERANEHDMEREADLEARLATLAGRVVDLETELSGARATLESNERARAIDAAVASSGALDPETVRLLLEREAEASPGAELLELLSALRDRKPVLFRRAVSAGSAMAATPSSRPGRAGLIEAKRAAEEGDRASLLRYLRLRREES